MHIYVLVPREGRRPAPEAFPLFVFGSPELDELHREQTEGRYVVKHPACNGAGEFFTLNTLHPGVCAIRMIDLERSPGGLLQPIGLVDTAP